LARLEKLSVIEQTLCEIYQEKLVIERAFAEPFDLIGFTVPFPGNLVGALRLAQWSKKQLPGTPVAMGGGYVNTELRQVQDARLFDWIDYLGFDDGEAVLDALLKLKETLPKNGVRLKYREGGRVQTSVQQKSELDAFKGRATPDYRGLPIDRYLAMLEMPNPMHRMWSDFFWNKLTLAHGCYWKKCSFCDVSLDYISRVEPETAERIVDQMDEISAQTGRSGFHFVDEACPPSLLKAVAKELLVRQRAYTWWGNLRFDHLFDQDTARLMADAGCVAVTGGLEVASPRLLALMNKGVTLEQVARVANAFSSAGIYVHAYLMYGFPSQTSAETVDALEFVRQLFAEGVIASGHWHRFVATIHSPVGRAPQKYGVELHPPQAPPEGLFAQNEIAFTDLSAKKDKVDHDLLGEGLRRALYNYMLGIGLSQPVHSWFSGSVPKASLPKNFVRQCLNRPG
jgi:radical SAM superfamily enzyme YgiQ (UPF0313 family)